jgi:hypothetical protein
MQCLNGLSQWGSFCAINLLGLNFTEMSDPVNHPAHYTSGGVECIDAIEASMTLEAFKGYLKGNCIKYLYRYENKNGLEDLKKCLWYLKRLISIVEGGRCYQEISPDDVLFCGNCVDG